MFRAPGRRAPVRRSGTFAAAAVLAIAAVAGAGAVTLRGRAQLGNPFQGARLFVDPDSNAYWASQNLLDAGRKADARAVAKIAHHSWASWFGDWSNGHGSLAADVRARVQQVTAAGALPVLVVYNIPHRDCGSYSAGGAAGPAAYRAWIDSFANAVGSVRAAVIVEPDAVAELDCLRPADQGTTLSLIRGAVDRLNKQPGISVYIDAGNESWASASAIAKRLRLAGIDHARGFALNVSNFYSTKTEQRYGDRISRFLGGKTHYIIDTSRDGRGPAPNDAWCNPPSAGLGPPPTSHTSDPLADAYVWVKAPGESDGSCRGAPAAGVWWLRGAIALGNRAAF
jgi:endoglucanase